MALIEEYYELNEAEEVTSAWKIFQIVFYISAACLGLISGYIMAILRIKFEDKCFLFTTLKTSKTNKSPKINPVINWEADSYCDFCQYTMVSSFIVGTIWATFFLMCGKGGKTATGLPKPWRIIWPSLIFNFIYFIIILHSAIYIQRGIDIFCARQVHKLKIDSGFTETCKTLKVLLHRNLDTAALLLELITKISWSCAVSWLVLFLIPLFRILFVIDFNLYKVCVFKIGEAVQNKKEEVLKITYYEEPIKVNVTTEDVQPSTADNEESVPEKRKKVKIEKKVVTILPKVTFHVSTDIRMLNREKKGKKSLHLLDQGFQRSKSNLVTKTTNILSKSGNSDVPKFSSLPYRCDVLDLEQMNFNQNGESLNNRILDYNRNPSQHSNQKKKISNEAKKDFSSKSKKYI